MRCPDCNKFVSYDEPQCQNDFTEIEGGQDDGIVRASVTVELNCQECGTVLKSATIEAEQEFTHTCKPESERDWTHTPDPGFDKDVDDNFTLENEGEPDGASRQETKDRNGKPIKNPRYMKTFYGFSMECSVKCNACGEEFPVDVTGEEQASAFEECC